MYVVIKKDGTHEDFISDKIKMAVTKSASRVMISLSEENKQDIVLKVLSHIAELDIEEIPITLMHSLVEEALEEFNPAIAKSYRDYRNYKQDFVHILDKTYEASQSIRFIGDKDNANTDSTLVATKRCLIFNELNKRFYRKFFMTKDELQACKEGYIYVHDQSARLDTMNCFDRSTRFITDRGVKSFYDFIDGDVINVITHKGSWKKATVHSYGRQKLQKVTFKRCSGKEKSVLVTPNHRWILKDGSYTTDLKLGDKLIYTPDITSFNWDFLSREEKKLWCLGFAFADGSIVKNNNIPTMVLRLCGNKEQYAERFLEVGYSVTYPKCLKGDAHIIMTDVHSKELPFMQLSKETVLFFTNGYLCADGNKNTKNSCSEFRGVQVTGELNNYMYDLLNMSGYYVTNVTDLTGQTTNYGQRKKDTKSYQTYSDCGDRTWVVTSIEEAKLNSNAQVWCLEVEDDHSFLLESGIPTGNCCLFDMTTVMSGGFEMGNVWYNEPKSLDTAFDVMGDIILSTASQQYGGFTVPEVDKVLAPYAEKSYKKYVEEIQDIKNEFTLTEDTSLRALEKVRRDFEQGFQGIEYKLNTVGSSRGDYPFITMSFGLGTTQFEKMASITFLKVHSEGQGKEGNKKPVLFPKLVFLYDKDLHEEGCPNYDVYEAGIECSCKTMYPDWLSLTGEGYVPEMYKKYKRVVSPMGCRAFLSPWYERGGMDPADEEDKPIFVGRFNIGAVSLHLPMILAKSKRENKDFYEVLDYYMQMIREIHQRTYEYLGELRASVNPIAYCEGGFLGGHLKPTDKIKPILNSATASFGFTALNELQELYNGKSLVEDGQFSLDTLKHINDKIAEFKEEDNILYAIYGTPAESLCFHGDTEVQTYGGNKKIKDITTDDLVYSFNEEEHKIELKKVIESKMTKQNSVVVKVTFDNGQEIICTPDHPFAVRRNNKDEKGMFIEKEHIEYVKASDLVAGDRIKSNYITLSDNGRPTCSIYHKGRKQLIQDINAEYNLGIKPQGVVTHHKDCDKENNSFENLEYMKSEEHKRFHVSDNIGKYSYTSESQIGFNNSFYGKQHTEESKVKNRMSHIGRSVERFSLDMKHLNHYECIEDASKLGFTRHLVKQACEGNRDLSQGSHYYKDSYWYYTDECIHLLEKNHKVVSVEVLSELLDVYNIEVEDNHNFFVGGNKGILVHNCGLQVEQFRKIYGITELVSDRPYVSNSFHCHVTEDISPIEKQDLENRFWNYSNGGKIQYVRYPLNYNKEAVKTLVLRAMKMGFYEGVNLSLAYCDECGYEELEMDVCPKCGSTNLTKIDRMNGYLSYSRVKGDTRLNKAKMAEIAERKSM